MVDIERMRENLQDLLEQVGDITHIEDAAERLDLLSQDIKRMIKNCDD